jgi:hypothetical protein
MAKKKQGRPKKKPGQGRDELLQVRTTTAEKRAFSRAAELCGQAVSVWARDALRRAAQAKLVESGEGDPFSSLQKGIAGHNDLTSA